MATVYEMDVFPSDEVDHMVNGTEDCEIGIESDVVFVTLTQVNGKIMWRDDEDTEQWAHGLSKSERDEILRQVKERLRTHNYVEH